MVALGSVGYGNIYQDLFLKARIWSGHSNKQEVNALDIAEAGFQPESMCGSRIVHVPPHL